MTGRRAALEAVLTDIGPMAVALSGGVDSMTLAHVAHGVGGDVAMYHAVSAAVPREATARVRRHADDHGWKLHLVDAGETRDERYVANPVDRCFFCKTNLYAHIAGATDRQIVSGTNRDDLGDYRPGLTAAADHGVRHPFVEAGIDKAAIRAIARSLGLDDLAELPAAPCLSSRIETGLRVTPRRLTTVDAVERFVRDRTEAENIRCRVRESGVVIEIDDEHVAATEVALREGVTELLQQLGVRAGLGFAPYERGAAFVHETGPS